MTKRGYTSIVVEIYECAPTSGKHGTRHIRPAPNQAFPQTLDVECNSTLTERYPVGTRFRMDVITKFRQGRGQHLYSFHGWREIVVP